MYKNFIAKLLFKLPPESAHKFALSSLNVAAKLGFKISVPNDPVNVLGLKFKNRIGLAAGFDKGGQYISGLTSLGFGFIEIGTVTPLAQLGNPKPRLFRLPKYSALINRMGFNNDGMYAVANRLAKQKYSGILGINIGKNKNTKDDKVINDYLLCFNKLAPVADYITINISSPNTQGLRAWQLPEKLASLLGAIKQAQKDLEKKINRYVPLVVKISPDIDSTEIENLAKSFLSFAVDAIIVTNTTVARPQIAEKKILSETGGLSGAPLFNKSTQVLKKFSAILQGKIHIIACGGIFSAKDYQEKLAAGATLVQAYTGLIYEGPRFVQYLSKK